MAPGIPEPTKQNREGNGPIGRRDGLYLDMFWTGYLWPMGGRRYGGVLNHRIAKDKAIAE